MKILSTLSDRYYLLNGLALYSSLLKHSSDFLLHYLCLDDDTYNVINSLPHCKAIHIKNFEQDPAFIQLKENNKIRSISDSDGQSDFHWALASFLCNYLLQYNNHCLYIDSDIFFYRDIQEVFNSVNNYDVGLVIHKHVKLDKVRPNVGYYNVGIIYFNGSYYGKYCCKWWSKVVANKNNPWYHPFGSCGDQKYLEMFEEIIPPEKIKLIDNDVGNAAPWNLPMTVLNNNKITWNTTNLNGENKLVTQDLCFYHFSHFTYSLSKQQWRHDREGEWGNILDSQDKILLYENYYKTIEDIVRGVK